MQRRLDAFFVAQGVTDVRLALADEPPTLNPISGKFRHVWSEVGQPAPARDDGTRPAQQRVRSNIV